MLTVMKTTHNSKTKDVWAKIPLQDFTLNSDIDWSKSISEIDQQFYKKYDLSEEEVSFIERKIKPMA
jgi:type II restriction enzyme